MPTSCVIGSAAGSWTTTRVCARSHVAERGGSADGGTSTRTSTCAATWWTPWVRDAATTPRCERLVGDLVSRPLDPGHPLWQIHLVRRTDGGSALVARFHHSLGDGLALAAVLLRLTDPIGGGTAGDASGRAGWSRTGARPGTARRVGRSLRAVTAMVRTAARIVDSLGEPPTLLRGDLGRRKSLAITRPHDLDDVRLTARTHGVSINDVLLTATAAGLRHHLLERGGAVADVRVLVPVDLRGGEPVPPTLGNRFGVVFVRLPVGEADPGERLRIVARSSRALRSSAEAGGTYLLLRLVGALPRLGRQVAAALLGESVSAVVTNVPGPHHRLAIGRCEVEDVVFWAPTIGRVGLGISLFSYAGAVTVGVAVDAALGVDASELAQAIEAEIVVLRDLALAAATSPTRGRDEGPV